jgi:V/A-type H+-transporting ATPase subunit D
MPLRAPPGRAGRLWLVRRLEVARRGVEVLDQKRQTLLREQQRLAETLAHSAGEWELKAREAAAWNERALAIAGERRLRLAAAPVAARCSVEVEWRNALGTVFPAGASVRPGPPRDVVAVGGGSVVALAAGAHAAAVAAAADYAAARAAHEAIAAELQATTRRQRAIERRWIPEHEAALHRAELALDEREREDIARVRWAVDRR